MRPRSAAVSVALVRRAAGHAAAWTRSHPLAADALLAAALIGAAVLSSRTWISLYRLGDPSYDLPTRFEELAGAGGAHRPPPPPRPAAPVSPGGGPPGV